MCHYVAYNIRVFLVPRAPNSGPHKIYVIVLRSIGEGFFHLSFSCLTYYYIVYNTIYIYLLFASLFTPEIVYGRSV